MNLLGNVTFVYNHISLFPSRVKRRSRPGEEQRGRHRATPSPGRGGPPSRRTWAPESQRSTFQQQQRQQQTRETEEAQNEVHAGTAPRTGAEFLKDALPRHIHEGRAGNENRPN